MRLLLLTPVRNLGRAGQVVEVTDGYARNYLLPRRLAKPATDAVMREREQSRLRSQHHQVAEISRHQALARAVAGTTVTFRRKASPNGVLFSALTRQEIATALDPHVPESSIALARPLKEIGKHAVTVRVQDAQDIVVSVIIESA